MLPAHPSRPLRWYTIPIRVLLITFIGTLLSFAVCLLLAILGTLIISAVRSMHPDMRIAYRLIALPLAIFAGCIIFIVASILEIRHYRQTKTLSAIERIS